MAIQITNRQVIGNKVRRAVARLVSFTPTSTITGTNLQDALEEVDTHITASTVVDDDEFEAGDILRDADSLGGKYTSAILDTMPKSETVDTVTVETPNIDADTLGGKYTADDITAINTKLSGSTIEVTSMWNVGHYVVGGNVRVYLPKPQFATTVSMTSATAQIFGDNGTWTSTTINEYAINRIGQFYVTLAPTSNITLGNSYLINLTAKISFS